MSHYKSYPKYKDSTIYWVKKVPENWEIAATGRALEPKNHNVGSLWRSTPLLSLTQKGVVNRDINNLTGKTHSDYSTYQIVEKHELIFCLFDIDETPRTVGLANSSGMITSAYNVFRARESANRVFLYFFFEFIDNCKGLKPFYTGMRKTVRPPEFLKIKIPLPPRVEQNLIAEHLATETTRIDALIEKKIRFIELLKEKRQALITQAVTKGLDPNVKMKDSGVEWLGEVPGHWGVHRLDCAAKIVRGNSSFAKGDLLDAGEYVALQYGKTYKVDEVDGSFSSYVNKEFFKDTQVAGFGDTVLVSTSETLEDLGHSCFYARHDRGLIGGEQFLLKPKHQTIGKYLYYMTKGFSFCLHSYATGLKVFRFGLDDLKTIYIPSTSIDEQQKIVQHIDRETARIDTVIEKTEQGITLLKERRAALITAAVTGQIDLRDAA